MALNLQTFKTRALTALVFVIVMLAGLLWNVWSFMTLLAIILFGCFFEFAELAKRIDPTKFIRNLLISFIYILLPILLLGNLRLTLISGQQTNNLHIGEADMPIVIPCTIIFSIWINDTMAYIVGSFIGKHPLSKISPKKTWEGTIGGAILCIIVITLIGKWTGFYRTTDWIAISSICAIFGTIGDLIESKLKRLAGVKDSGTLMPGHGGFLDRFDSLLISVPFVWVYVELFMK
jgi:phosphatidate cytidylyltransferase